MFITVVLPIINSKINFRLDSKQQRKEAIKSSITQRLRTNLGKSVGVTDATQLVWLAGDGKLKKEKGDARKEQRG